MRENIDAKTAEGRTCLSKCGRWRSKEHFFVTRYGSLEAICKDCKRDKVREQNKARRQDPEKYRAMREANARCRANLKQEVITAYGGKCSCCGESTPAFLSLDHVHNDGAEDRRKSNNSGGSNQWYIARSKGYPDYLQLMCFNCNLGRHINGGVCPHQEQD